MFKTGSNRLAVIMLTFFAYLLSSVLFVSWIYLELSAGVFSAESDSIGLPIAGFVLLWIVGLPFLIMAYILMEVLCRKYYRTDDQ